MAFCTRQHAYDVFGYVLVVQPDESVEMQFEIEYETSEAEAHRRIQRELDNHQARHRGPTVRRLPPFPRRSLRRL